jgi:TPR repeat protein
VLAPTDVAAAGKAATKACSGGEALGCRVLGKVTLAANGATKSAGNDDRAEKLFQQACSGGDDEACGELGTLLGASSKADDRARALAAHQRACDGRVATSCSAAGELYDSGAPGVPKNAIIAEMLFRRGCIRNDGPSCADLGRALLSRSQGSGGDEARLSFERACTARVAAGCAALKVVFHDSRPVFPDIKEKQQLTSRCMAGAARDCGTSGLLDVASGNVAFGKTTLERACTMGDAWSCFLVKQIH